MLCCRVLLLVAVMLLTACMTCSILFPVLRKTETDTSGSVTTRETVYYWYWETSNSSTATSGTPAPVRRRYTRDLDCDRARAFYTASSALSVSAAGLGGVTALVISCWSAAGFNYSIGVSALLLTFLTMACAVVVLAFTVYGYTNGFCDDDAQPIAGSTKEGGYKLVEGFILLCVAAGGLFLLTVAEAIGLCCCCQPAEEESPERARSPKTSRADHYSDADE